ncbi:MAG TPA: nitrite reductase small subunit NirD [Pseudobacter sp.]|nr:nitrite reductase small subunit NirD [Pseudobacter sp.]
MFSEEILTWSYACSADEVPANGGVCVKLGDHQVALYNFARRGQWFATQNLCPHRQEMALSRGMIGSVNGEPKVACPFHKRTFSLLTGECFEGDCDHIKVFPVKVEEGRIYIGMPARESVLMQIQ